jgi:hypothetical protein
MPVGGERELTAATAVVQQWHLLSMVVAVNGGSGNSIVAAAVGEGMTTTQWWQR